MAAGKKSLAWEEEQLDFVFPQGPANPAQPPGARPSPSRRPHASAAAPQIARAKQLILTLEHQADGDELRASLRGKVRVEQILRDTIGPKVMVSLTGNRSTMISFKVRRSVLYVRLHAMFADAPTEVLRAVGYFVSKSRITPRQGALIDDWIESHRHHIRKPAEGPGVLQPVGEIHDLGAMLRALNKSFFENKIGADITWSRSQRNLKRTSIRMGSYCDELKLIRIHPALDQAFVPRYFVESVVFHEMLHEAHGILETESGRRCIHTPQFNADEKKFPRYLEARKWESKHLSKLLRY